MSLNQIAVLQKKQTPFTLGIIGCIGILLNQSSVLFGVNLSFADFFLVLLAFMWIVNKEFEFPSFPLLLFLLFSIFLLLNSVFIIPQQQNFQINYRLVATDYIKLLTIALYFLVGYQLEKKQLLKQVLYAFVLGAVLTSIIGFFLLFFPIPKLSEIMLYAGVRLNGFMNDPNYFSVIQCAAIVVTLFLVPKNTALNYLLLSILISSILLSASKTGAITLVLCLIYCLYYLIKEGIFNWKKWLSITIALMIFFALLPILFTLLQNVLDTISYHFPIFERVQVLFTDFERATRESGSGRGEVWETAITMTRSHPLLGVGIGNYTEIAYRISGDPNVAHNTYLQLSAEWGVPTTILLISYVIYLVLAPVRYYVGKHRFIVKGILFIFLISSLAISFNNSRLFWFMLGIASAQQSVEWLNEKEKEND